MTLLSVLSVASEAYPLAKTGGLADVVGALPAALAEENVRTRTLLPGYPAVLSALDEGAQAVASFGDLCGGKARLIAGRAGGLDVLVLVAPHLYARVGSLYTDAEGRDWPDNALRFAALARVAERLCRGLVPSYVPDLVHAHDWQAGLVPAFLYYGEGRRPVSVLTVHNLAFQGQFPPHLLAQIGLPPGAYNVEGVEYYGSIGYLKAGIRFADRVTTVSPTYAAEISTAEFGMGLDGLLRARGGAVLGILNGLDDVAWDPATDPHIAAHYDATNLAGRDACRKALREEFDLDDVPGRPILGVVSRLSWQKGTDLILDVAPALVRDGIQIVVLGTGELALENALRALAKTYPGKVGVRIAYNEGLAHRVQAGCDSLVVPSRFEPCGLTQLCALRYGAVPLVSHTGGLADTVVDANEAALAAGVATGVQFWPTTGEALGAAMNRLLSLWDDQGAWRRVQCNGMATNVGWRRSAGRYAALYRAVLDERIR